MKFWHRIGFHIAAIVVFGISFAAGSSTTQDSKTPAPVPASDAQTVAPAVVLRVKILLIKDNPALEVVTNRPVVPSIRKVDDPSRLMIDLPNASMSVQHKLISINTEQLGELHLDEVTGDNQAVHMVIDLRKPLLYTWEAAGNRLTIRLQPAEPNAVNAASNATPPTQATLQPPSVAALTRGVQGGLVPVSGGFGAVIFAGNKVSSGSTITAGAETAVLSLGRGGQIFLCPKSTISVTSSSGGHDLMLGMSTGSLEAHYSLDASINSVLTPDFRIVLAGPGVFSYAISADPQGNTCVSALPGNERSAIVSELIGTGSYEVKANEQVFFRRGRVEAPDNAYAGSCGCPVPIPTMTASQTPGPVTPDSKLPSSVQIAQAGDPNRGITPGSETSAPPQAKPNDVQAQVEAPLIFRASDLPPAHPAAKPKSETSSLILQDPKRAVATSSRPASITITTSEKPHHGFFGKVKGFFKKVF